MAGLERSNLGCKSEPFSKRVGPNYYRARDEPYYYHCATNLVIDDYTNIYRQNYPYYSPRVDLLYGYRTVTEPMYTFRPFKEFDLEDFGNAERIEGIDFSLWDSRILLLTSNPYCHATVQRPFYGIADGYSLTFMPTDFNEYLKQSAEANVTEGPYFFSGTKEGSSLRVKTWAENPSLAFDPPHKRTELQQASFDCCPPTWEFEDFVLSSDWNTNPFITYQKYTLHKTWKGVCGAELKSGGMIPFQSFLIEVGKRCEWMRLCFDDEGKFCESDANTLALIFVHDVYIPTDSDNARPIGVEFKELDPIRINFLIGHKAIEMAYAFSSVTAAGITDLMQLDKYDGKDPSKLEINVVKAPYCEARLLNDMGAVNIQKGLEAGSQCLSISSCTCLE
ncbi:unnamed protein product [Angiostrongylus costaricensis]|uniref:Sema domain-containing protein n=1 Tax=Angiostrongylus costaricensis TaxID=334426 RepID=A0A158PIM3_ANGCS|nr:unnamed protein product [Angiostrongylus costaricensis]